MTAGLALTVLASGVSTNGIDLTGLIQYGVLGLVAILMILGKIVPWSYYDEKKAEIERLNAVIDQRNKDIETVRTAKDEEIKALRSALEDRIIPLTIRLLDVVERRPVSRGKS